jgi:hypothetical protein
MSQLVLINDRHGIPRNTGFEAIHAYKTSILERQLYFGYKTHYPVLSLPNLRAFGSRSPQI